MNTDTLIRFYVNNGTDVTVQMLKAEGLGSWLMSVENDNTSAWAKQVARHLLVEYKK